MRGNSRESRRVLIAGVSACVALSFLIVFTVMVYNGKRKTADDLAGNTGPVASFPLPVSTADESVYGENQNSMEEVSSEEVSSGMVSDISSDSISSEEISSAVTSDAPAKSEPILNPDKKSDYYIVVYTDTQTVTVYKKNSKGAYSINFRSMICSTGFNSSDAKAEGVYRVGSKKLWNKLSDGLFRRYCCLIDEQSELVISSVPYQQKKVSTMVDSAYADLGKPVESSNVQLCLRDARWVYNNIPEGTQVHIFAEKGPKADSIPKVKTASKYKGWDPSDRWSSGNPYFQNQTTTTTAAAEQPDTTNG